MSCPVGHNCGVGMRAGLGLQDVGLGALAVAVLAGALFAVQGPGEAPAAQQPAAAVATYPAAPEQVAALFVGDSFTAGTGAADQQHAESCLTAAELGWICNLDAQGGTGFVADGRADSPTSGPLASRLAQTHQHYLADVIVVDAGRNDAALPAAQVRGAVTAYLKALRAAWPEAELVLVAPYFLDSTSPLGTPGTAFLRAQAERFDAQLIDPVGEGWVRDDRTSGLTVEDGVHPSPEGHAYLARHLVEDLRRLGLGDVSITDLRGARSAA